MLLKNMQKNTPHKPTLSLIWAMADNRVIGIENRLPWKLPADMKWFRQNTLGKPIIMGRLTFESFGAKPLPGRRNIIISRNPSYAAEGIETYSSLEEALKATQSDDEVMIIGGMSLYQQALPLADRLYMTLVHTAADGDAWFPEFDLQQWHETERSDFPADEKNPHPYSFIILDKQPGA
jgi:dihydrofolate reductase